MFLRPYPITFLIRPPPSPFTTTTTTIHPALHHLSLSLSLSFRETIWCLRVEALENRVLCGWSHFTIWNGGKQGRRLYRSLSQENQAKVAAFCDVDQKKIAQGAYTYEESKSTPKPQVPILHYSQASPPFVLCVKLVSKKTLSCHTSIMSLLTSLSSFTLPKGLTGGEFEKNLASLHLKEGVDYYHFS